MLIHPLCSHVASALKGLMKDVAADETFVEENDLDDVVSTLTLRS